MKIISKIKDYYDFVVFETDNRKVYNRDFKFISPYSYEEFVKENESFKKPINYILEHSFDLSENIQLNNQINYYIGCVLFCNEIYHYVYDVENKKYYYSYIEIPKEIRNRIDKVLDGYKNRYYSLETIFGIENKKSWIKSYLWWNNSNESDLKSFNTQCDCPVLFSKLKDDILHSIVLNGRLEDINFSQVKKPTEAYTDIYNFIPYVEPELDSNPTDMNRYESKGFDKKTSFRKDRKKKKK
jgi:hypothetical protein